MEGLIGVSEYDERYTKTVNVVMSYYDAMKVFKCELVEWYQQECNYTLSAAQKKWDWDSMHFNQNVYNKMLKLAKERVNNGKLREF